MTAPHAAPIARCETCQDSHQMWHAGLDRYVPCTRCPVPCRECASSDGRGAYCAVADCHCACHHWMGVNERGVPRPTPPSRDDLVALLHRWRALEQPPEPDLDDDAALRDYAQWREAHEALADETDRALAAEARRAVPAAEPEVLP